MYVGNFHPICPRKRSEFSDLNSMFSLRTTSEGQQFEQKINRLASDKLEARRSEREILRKLRDGSVHLECSQVIVVRQPLIFRIAIQERDLALGRSKQSSIGIAPVLTAVRYGPRSNIECRPSVERQSSP
jgi:hypothetical protein